MTKESAYYLLHKANELKCEADYIFDTTNNSDISSIIRQSAWFIEKHIPANYKVEALLEGTS